MKRIMLMTLSAVLCAACGSSAPEGLYTKKVGKFEVTVLPENQGEGNASILVGATQAILDETAPNGTFPNAVNAFMVKTPDHNILFDTGFGRNLFSNLELMGLGAGDIDIVILTHMHGDHVGGLLVDGQKAFPNAKIIVPQPEFAYWTDEAIMNAQEERGRGGFQTAIKIGEVYAGNIELINLTMMGSPTVEVVPGITAVRTFGHTPGHAGYLLESNGDKLFIWGDLAHVMAIQMPYPWISATYDTDPEMAAVSRTEVIDMVIPNNIPIAGMHIAFPGMGTLKWSEKEDQVCEFVPFD